MTSNPLTDPNLLRSMSTNADISYLRRNFTPIVGNRLREQLNLTDQPEHRFNNDWVDPLNPVMRRLRNLDKRLMRPIVYTGQKLTTLSYQIYGTTSLWYVPLYISGFCHPHEITHGAVLYFPELKLVADLIKPGTKSKRGSIVKA